MNAKKIIFLDGDKSSLINIGENIEINGKKILINSKQMIKHRDDYDDYDHYSTSQHIKNLKNNGIDFKEYLEMNNIEFEETKYDDLFLIIGSAPIDINEIAEAFYITIFMDRESLNDYLDTMNL